MVQPIFPVRARLVSRPPASEQALGAQQLRQGDKSLVGNKGYRRYLKVEGEGHFQVDEAQVQAEARYDGRWILRTNTRYDAKTVAHVYKTLWTVEQSFRTAKSILETKAPLSSE